MKSAFFNNYLFINYCFSVFGYKKTVLFGGFININVINTTTGS